MVAKKLDSIYPKILNIFSQILKSVLLARELHSLDRIMNLAICVACEIMAIFSLYQGTLGVHLLGSALLILS